MAADVLAPCVSQLSATMTLMLWNGKVQGRVSPTNKGHLRIEEWYQMETRIYIHVLENTRQGLTTPGFSSESHRICYPIAVPDIYVATIVSS